VLINYPFDDIEKPIICLEFYILYTSLMPSVKIANLKNVGYIYLGSEGF